MTGTTSLIMGIFVLFKGKNKGDMRTGGSEKFIELAEYLNNLIRVDKRVWLLHSIFYL